MAITTFFKTVECVADVTAPLPPSFADWPANIQDRLLKQLEMASLRDGCKYSVVGSTAGVDLDSGPYVHVLAAAEVKLDA